MSMRTPIWAVVPVKETAAAKRRLATVLSPRLRQELALAMLEDVLAALGAARGLTGIMVVTIDEAATQIAARYGAVISRDDSIEGHTGAVMGAARSLAKRGAAMLTLPGDVPLVTPADIERLIATRSGAPGFTIVPARDELGSNAVLCAPADAVLLRFGENSFFPHLAAARAVGIAPMILQLPRLGLDIDGPDDLNAFLKIPSATRARALLDRHGIVCSVMETEA